MMSGNPLPSDAPQSALNAYFQLDQSSRSEKKQSAEIIEAKKQAEEAIIQYMCCQNPPLSYIQYLDKYLVIKRTVSLMPCCDELHEATFKEFLNQYGSSGIPLDELAVRYSNFVREVRGRGGKNTIKLRVSKTRPMSDTLTELLGSGHM